jgi:hypothetical protein
MDSELQENRLKNFANFFKGYMGGMPLITAALAPILTLAKAIPVFESQKTSLATFSGLFGFLLVAWIFFARGTFVPLMTNSLTRAVSDSNETPSPVVALAQLLKRDIPRIFIMMLPLSLIILSAYSYISYSQRLDSALDAVLNPGGTDPRGLSAQSDPRQFMLQKMGANQTIPGATMLQVTYLGIFLSAELAFVLMALREYAYGTLHISEHDVLSGALSATPSDGRTMDIDDARPKKPPASQ